MAEATKILDRIAIGIGAQTAQGTDNAHVPAATELIAGVAASGDATGIYVQRESVNMSFNRIESAPRRFEDTYAEMGGALYRIEPVLSFSMEAVGGGQTSYSTEGDYDLTEAMTRILAGAGINKGTSGTSSTPYEMDASTIEYQTIKLWRGSAGSSNDVAYVYHDCLFDITWNFTASEIATMEVTVHAGSVTRQEDETFPDDIAYGTQDTTTSPVLRGAGAYFGDGDPTRGFVNGSVSIANSIEMVGDSNASTGVVAEHTGKRVEMSADWYMGSQFESTDVSDYEKLEADAMTSTTAEFTLGSAAAASAIANGLKFNLSNLRSTGISRTQVGDRAAHTISGYGVTDASGANKVLTITGV